MPTNQHAERPIAELTHADMATRLRALRELKHLAETGKVAVDGPKPWVNMHCHTWYSYNAHDYSPCRVAWELYKRGVSLGGMIDFDVLDGLDEGLALSDGLLYKFIVGMETRVYIEDFASEVMNSPNEPGIAYFCGVGFVAPPAPKSDGAHTLSRMRKGAEKRNRAMLKRVNEYLGDVQIDYDTDVLPLCPSGNATERHMLGAFEEQGEKVFPDIKARAHYWATKLLMSESEIAQLMADSVQFRNTLRSKLMKFGSPGYASPDPRNFPTLADATEMIRSCGALPALTWLDGTSSGEADAELLIDYYINSGSVVSCFVPDRNWNLKDPAQKAIKVAKMNEFIEGCKKRQLPLVIGTEMNSSSQPLVDHFDVPELKPHVQDFLEGAQIVWGHSLLLRHGGFGYISPQADAEFGKDIRKKNAFFLEVGRRPVPHGADLAKLRNASHKADSKAVLRALGA
jgi:hypothetical protein